jgi:hypothetical protein
VRIWWLLLLRSFILVSEVARWLAPWAMRRTTSSALSTSTYTQGHTSDVVWVRRSGFVGFVESCPLSFHLSRLIRNRMQLTMAGVAGCRQSCVAAAQRALSKVEPVTYLCCARHVAATSLCCQNVQLVDAAPAVYQQVAQVFVVYFQHLHPEVVLRLQGNNISTYRKAAVSACLPHIMVLAGALTAAVTILLPCKLQHNP